MSRLRHPESPADRLQLPLLCLLKIRNELSEGTLSVDQVDNIYMESIGNLHCHRHDNLCIAVLYLPDGSLVLIAQDLGKLCLRHPELLSLILNILTEIHINLQGVSTRITRAIVDCNSFFFKKIGNKVIDIRHSILYSRIRFDMEGNQMMKHEFEKLAGYQVSWEDYNNILEPMYSALPDNITKEQFVEMIDRKRFSVTDKKRKMVREMRKIATYIFEHCGQASFCEEEQQLHSMIQEYEEQFLQIDPRDSGAGYYVDRKHAYRGYLQDRGCSFPYKVGFFRGDNMMAELILVKLGA